MTPPVPCATLPAHYAWIDAERLRAGKSGGEALAVARECENQRIVGEALNGLGQIAAGAGDLERAEALIQESLAPQVEDPKTVHASVHRMNLGSIAKLRGDLGHATELTEKSLGTFRQTGNEYLIATALSSS